MISKKDFNCVSEDRKEDSEQIREGLTYWKDTWRRLKKNKLSLIGLVVIILITLFGVVGPWLTPYSYSDQVVGYSNIPPRLTLTKFDDGTYFYFNCTQYNIYAVTKKGTIIQKLPETSRDIPNRKFYFSYDSTFVTYP